MHLFVGLDDTDNAESRGTGYRARQLGDLLSESGVAVASITRHQLLVDPRIPYTSHNSSACLALWIADGGEDAEQLAARCRTFLLRESADGSDAGLCIARATNVNGAVTAFGRRAKVEVLAMAEARQVAASEGIVLEGLTGAGTGIIGALAAVGLRASGNDGRVLWLHGLRELEGVLEVGALCARLGVDAVETAAGRAARAGERVHVGDWPRPIVRGGRIVFIVEEADGSHGAGDEHEWRMADRSRIKALSS